MVIATTDYLKPINFLVVDEKPYMRRVVKNVLETLGAKHVEEAPDGRAAMASIKQWEPDILLCETWLSPMSGVELLRAIRADKTQMRFLPVIMVTSETRREKVIEARNAGVTEYVAKPISGKSLFLRIREVIERPRPFVDTKVYFGPDRRRRSEALSQGEDRRGQGGERPKGPEAPGNEGLTQKEIDKLVAGEEISDFGLPR